MTGAPANDASAAHNKALKHATGDFILWLDVDDRIDQRKRDTLRRLLANLPDANAAYSLRL